MGCTGSTPTLDPETHRLKQTTGKLQFEKLPQEANSTRATRHGSISETLKGNRKDSKNILLAPEPPYFGLRLSFEEIKFSRSIGTGTYGEVFKAKVRGHQVAVKRIVFADRQTQKEYDDTINDFKKEVRILEFLQHPQIVRFLGAVTVEPRYCLVFELLQGSVGSLLKLIRKNRIQVSWSICLSIARDAAMAVNYLHRLSPRVIHRDLKAENLLLTSDFRCKLTDFGLSRAYNGIRSAMTVCGTPSWVAPEMFRQEPYTETVDTYSFGIVLWELFAGEKPHNGKTAAELPYLVGRKGLRPPLLPHCPPSLNSLMRNCWDETAAIRPQFQSILKSLENIESEIGFYRKLGEPVHASKNEEWTHAPLSRREVRQFTEGKQQEASESSFKMSLTMIQT